jgi:hypothetical protein
MIPFHLLIIQYYHSENANIVIHKDSRNLQVDIYAYLHGESYVKKTHLSTVAGYISAN